MWWLLLLIHEFGVIKQSAAVTLGQGQADGFAGGGSTCAGCM
jgi:hypothetical protein